MTRFPKYALMMIALAAIVSDGCSRPKEIVEDYELIIPAEDSITLPTTEEIAIDSVKPQEIESVEEAIEFMENSDHSEQYMAGILPQMARDELSYCKKLLDNRHPHFFIVDKAQMEIVVFDRYGREEKRVGMACSKNFGTKHHRRDNRTPEGYFSVKGVYNSTEWLYTDDDGKTSDKKGQFGPRFIRLNIPVTTQIGIHGTSSPWSIGHRRSHGCIRVTNDNIMELVEYVDSGMPVIVSPGSRDMAVNEDEGYYVPAVSTRRSGAKATLRGYYDPAAVKKETRVETADPDTTPSVLPEEPIEVEEPVKPDTVHD